MATLGCLVIFAQMKRSIIIDAFKRSSGPVQLYMDDGMMLLLGSRNWGRDFSYNQPHKQTLPSFTAKCS